jgi:hypothetical protein
VIEFFLTTFFAYRVAWYLESARSRVGFSPGAKICYVLKQIRIFLGTVQLLTRWTLDLEVGGSSLSQVIKFI